MCSHCSLGIHIDSHSIRVTRSCKGFHCARFTLVNRITMLKLGCDQPNSSCHSPAPLLTPAPHCSRRQAGGCLVLPSQKRKSCNGNMQQSLLLLSYPFPSLQALHTLRGQCQKLFPMPCLGSQKSISSSVPCTPSPLVRHPCHPGNWLIFMV